MGNSYLNRCRFLKSLRDFIASDSPREGTITAPPADKLMAGDYGVCSLGRLSNMAFPSSRWADVVGCNTSQKKDSGEPFTVRISKLTSGHVVGSRKRQSIAPVPGETVAKAGGVATKLRPGVEVPLSIVWVAVCISASMILAPSSRAAKPFRASANKLLWLSVSIVSAPEFGPSKRGKP